MIRRLFRLTLKFAVVGGAAAGVAKVLSRRRNGPDATATITPWPSIPEPAETPTPTPGDPVASGTATDTADDSAGADANGARVWAEPEDDGTCPTTHPVKAKMGSGVFHLPGMANYDRTKADRCYPDDATAEADGLRQAKR